MSSSSVYLLPKELDEKVAELHFPALHSPYSETRRLWALQSFSFLFHSRVLSRAAFSIQYSDEKKSRSGSRSGRTLRGSSSSAGRPRHESSIAKNYLKSSSIEKNCLRSSSTWTSGVHRDKESLPNAGSAGPETVRTLLVVDVPVHCGKRSGHGIAECMRGGNI